jgi:ATP-dependent Clp protease ATP-binding subunit ClpA
LGAVYGARIVTTAFIKIDCHVLKNKVDVAERCTQIDTGARNIDFIIARTVLPEVSKAMLAKWPKGKFRQSGAGDE